MDRNPRLVYGRMTGWGQEGPLASAAGHDIDYIALAGALWPIGRVGEPPVPPLNLVGDFGGGGMLLAFGMCAALLEAQRSGLGQVVDAAMVDGAASLMTMTFAFRRLGLWTEGRGVNILDTGAPFYEVYDTADGKWFAVGAIERAFLRRAGQGPRARGRGAPAAERPGTVARHEGALRGHLPHPDPRRMGRAFAGTDACGAPVLSPWEAHAHPHNEHRSTFVEVDGVVQPGPVPRFSRTPATVSRPPSVAGHDTDEALQSWGIDERPDRGPRARVAPSTEGGRTLPPSDARLTTGQVTVRVMPSMSWMWLTTMRPRSSTDAASSARSRRRAP